MFLPVFRPLCIAAVFVCFASGLAEANAAPAPSPEPSASPKIRRLTVAAHGYVSATNQQFIGPGTTPIEGPGFVAGSRVAPSTPYDFTSGGPLTTGFGFIEAIVISPSYTITPDLSVTANIDFGTIGGSGNVASYWGEQALPQINPHVGQRQINVPPAFATHNGQDAVKGGIVGVESGELATRDGSFSLRAGWIDQKQSESYVFAAAPVTNTSGNLAPQLTDSLSDGPPSIDAFVPLARQLPLHGIDAYYKHGVASLEATDADLPTLPGTPARATTFSLKLDHRQGLNYGFEVAHVKTGGFPIVTDTLSGGIGGPGMVFVAPGYPGSGSLVQSLLGGQTTTIVGASANVPLANSTDVSAKFAYSMYGADGTRSSAKSTGGGYYYGKIHHGFGGFEIAAEVMKYDPSYAPIQVPYGTLENVWSAPYAYPHNAAKSFYTINDSTLVGPNRQGFRLSGATDLRGVDVRLAYANEDQINVFDAGNAQQPGFIEPYFTPELGGAASLGNEQHSSASLAWHPKFADVNLDLTDVVTTRASLHPSDAVAMNYPSALLTLSRPLNPRLFGAVGAGTFGLHGSYDNSGPNNVDLEQDVVFAGLQYSNDGKQIYHLQYRMYSVKGAPTTAFGRSPAYHGPQIIFEQRFKL